MKKIFTVLAAVAAVFSLVSCNDIKDGGVKIGGNGSLSVSVSQGEIATKAPSTAVVGYESQINRLDFFLFEGNATLYIHKTVTSPTFDASGNFTQTFDRLPVSSYTVVVVANASETIAATKTLANLRAAAITLADCSLSASTGFVMYAEKASVNVAGGATTQLSGNDKLTLTRFPARVRLKSVSNKIPASAAYADNNVIKVKGVFLTNVNSAWRLDGTGVAGTGTNLKGRKGSTKISKASDLVYPQTGKFDTAVNVAVDGTQNISWDSYGFPTSAAIDGSPLRLVVFANVNGVDYYYPVKLIDSDKGRAGIERNKTYEVSVSIYGIGSDDPDVDVVRGALSATVTVAPWVAGQEWSEDI